jgi:anaerobic ribonucleoside-triphosphate reductase activating protein
MKNIEWMFHITFVQNCIILQRSVIHINYHNITHDDMNNGDGLRVVLWLSGCSHHCFNCQNPQTWDPDSGIPFDELAKQEIFNELSKDYISGITLSGGDPLHENNLSEVLSLVEEILNLFPSKTIWLYTGYTCENLIDGIHYPLDATWEDSVIRKSIIKLCDVLVDGEYIDEQRNITLPWRGSSNQRVIDVQKSLKQGKVVLYCD